VTGVQTCALPIYRARLDARLAPEPRAAAQRPHQSAAVPAWQAELADRRCAARPVPDPTPGTSAQQPAGHPPAQPVDRAMKPARVRLGDLSVGSVLSLAAALRERGHDPQPLLAQYDLDPARLGEPRAR